MAGANSYEEQRRRQVGENKRKLEELRLHNLSAAVRQAAVMPMLTKLATPRNPGLDAPIRRSGRIATLPEQADYRPAKKQRNEGARLPYPVPVYATNEQKAYAITKAEELKDQLGSDCYATKADQLIIPTHFRQYLLVHDETMVLVDEMNNEFDVLYSYKQHHKVRLIRWKGFATEHKLADGDCLVFQLIERRKFKVYIVRASSYNKDDR